MKLEKLGVDVGGVLIDRIRADGSDTSFFSDGFLDTPSVEGAFDTLERLSRGRFGDRIVVVSKCGPRTEAKTKLWLAHHGLLKRLGLAVDSVHFCRERRDKAPICRRLGVTHFIDDRFDVLRHLDSVPNCYLFGPQERDAEAPGVIHVETWAALESLLL